MFGCLFLVVLLVPLVFSLFTYENFEIIKFSVLLVFTGIALVVAFARFRPAGSQARGSKAFFYFLFLFWLWALLASLFAWDKNYSFFGFYARFTNGFIFYTVWAILIFLFSILDWEQARFLLKTAVMVSGLVALWGLMQSVGWGFYLGLTTDFFSRLAPSFLGNTDFSSMFVAATLPLTAVFFYRSQKVRQKIYYAVVGFIQLWSLAVFASRGAFFALSVGLLVSVVLIIKFARKNKLLWLGSIIILAVLGIGFGAKFLDFTRPSLVNSSLVLSDVNVQYRLNVWRLSAESVVKRPLFGVGLGSFQLMFEHDRPSPLIDAGFFDDAHNLPLELAVTGGLPMVIWFLCLIAAACLACCRSLLKDPQPEQMALIAALAIWLAAASFTPVPVPCYVLLALLLSACFKNSLGNLPQKSFLKTGAIIAGTALAVYGCLFFTAETLFYAGTEAYSSGNFAKVYNLATAAVWLNPSNRLYYVFRTAGAIRSNQPLPLDFRLLSQTKQLNSRRAYGYVELADLDYLLLYQTRNPVYMDSVLENLKTAMTLDKFSAGNYFTLSSYELVFGHLAEAQQAARQGLALEPAFEQGQIFLAKTYQLQNNKKEALEALSKAAKINPDDLSVLQLWHQIQQAKDIRAVPFNIDLGLGSID